MHRCPRGAVTGKRLRIVAARAGERLEDLAARSGNVWSAAYTALVNGLKGDASLQKGPLVKIAREERWTKSPPWRTQDHETHRKP